MFKGGMVRSLVFVALMAAGCGRRGEQPAACVPGAVVVCPCAGAPVGSQTCQSNGTFGACACSTAPAARADDPDKPPPVVAAMDTPAPPPTTAIVRAPAASPQPAVRPVVRAASVSPELANRCAGGYSCETCTPLQGCAWCGASQACVPVPSNTCRGPESRECRDGWACNPSESHGSPAAGSRCGGHRQVPCPGYQCTDGQLVVGQFCP